MNIFLFEQLLSDVINLSFFLYKKHLTSHNRIQTFMTKKNDVMTLRTLLEYLLTLNLKYCFLFGTNSIIFDYLIYWKTGELGICYKDIENIP